MLLNRTFHLGLALIASVVASPVLAQNQAALAARTDAIVGGLCGAAGNPAAFEATTCDVQALGGAAAAQAGLQASPREATAAGATATQTTTSQVETQKTRLEEARVEPKPDANADSAARFGGFLNGTGGFGEVDARGETDEYDVYGGGITTGVDYRVNDNIVAGLGFGWNRQTAEYDRQSAVNGGSVGGSEIESDAYTPSLYASFFHGPLYLDGVLTYTYLDYEFERVVDLPDNATALSGTAEGDTDAHQFGASIGGGYGFELGPVTAGPAAQFNYLVTSIDGYTESGAPGLLNLRYDDQTIRSAILSLGGDASMAISTGFGVVIPHVRASWEHEFENDSRTIDSRLVGNPNAAQDTRLFSITQSPDRDYGRVGGGVAAQLKDGFSAFVDYDALIGLSDVEYHRFTAGGRMEF